MRRAFVSLPDGIWKILDKDFKHKIGEGDSEVIRNIVIAYLSDHNYFINKKGGNIARQTNEHLENLYFLQDTLVDILDDKGHLKRSEWDRIIDKKQMEKNSRPK